MTVSQTTNSPSTAAPHDPQRRHVLGWASAVFGALATAAAGVPILGYLFSPLLRTPANQWIDLGAVEDFPEKQTRLVDFGGVRASRERGRIPGLLRKLHALGLSCFVVSAVGLVPLSVPWRRVLRGR